MPQSILFNTIVATVGRFVNVALGIIVTAIVTRWLGASGYGVYAVVVSFGTMLQIAADFGLYLTLTRDIANPTSNKQAIYGSIASLRLILLAALFTIGGSIWFLVPSYRALAPVLVIIAVGLTFQSISQLLMGVYQAAGTVWRATIGDVAGRIVQLGAVILFPFMMKYWSIAASQSVMYFATAFTLGTGVSLGVHSLLISPLKAWRLTGSRPQWKSIIKQSWPLGLLLLLNIIYFRIDIVMLSFWWPGASVGWYGLAYKIIESLLFFPAMLGGLLLPRFSQYYSQSNWRSMRQLLQQSLQVVMQVAALVALILLLFAQPIAIFLSGQEFAAAAPLIQILTFALAMMFFGNIFGFVLVSAHKQMFLLKLYCVLVIINISANAIAIPVFGATAAAWTTVLTEAIATIAAGIKTWHLIKYTLPTTRVIGTVYMVVVTALIASRLPATWHIGIRIAGVMGCYLLGGFALGIIKRSHINLLLSRHEYV